jgi:hypothetical protein
MEYLIVNHSIETNDGPLPGTPEFGEMMGQWMAYNQMLIDNGHWIGGASLTPSACDVVFARRTTQLGGGECDVGWPTCRVAHAR